MSDMQTPVSGGLRTEAKTMPTVMDYPWGRRAVEAALLIHDEVYKPRHYTEYGTIPDAADMACIIAQVFAEHGGTTAQAPGTPAYTLDDFESGRDVPPEIYEKYLQAYSEEYGGGKPESQDVYEFIGRQLEKDAIAAGNRAAFPGGIV